MEPVANRNQITLRGSLVSLPEFSHENHGKRFFRFFLEVPRLSGAIDTLPVITEETILNAVDLSGGEMLTVLCATLAVPLISALIMLFRRGK